MRLLALLAIALLAGCLGSPEPAATPAEDSEEAPPTTPSTTEADEGVVPAPDLPAGRTFTYRADGIYNDPGDLTVVVTREGSGYLFAGAAESDLYEDSVWPRPWFGHRDARLNKEGATYFDFPLEDGKSWEAFGLTMTARAADVATPSGREAGFVVEGENDRHHVRYEYAPSVGFFTSFRSGRGDVLYQNIALQRVGTASEWVWLETGPREYAGEPTKPTAALVVPADFDTVVVALGAMNGGWAAVAPPVTAAEAPSRFESPSGESWTYRAWPATEGPWTLAASAPEGGYGWAEGVAVKWVRGTV